ncbi:MAG: YihY/virulence factor BrkB family protein [Gemmatimonadaceae bacterium]
MTGIAGASKHETGSKTFSSGERRLRLRLFTGDAGPPYFLSMKLQLGGYDVVVLAKKTVREILDDNVLVLSAETAYSFFFGLFPTFLFAAPLISIVSNKQRLFDQLSGWLGGSLPPDAFTLTRGVLHDVIFAKNAPGLVSVGAILALYAGAGMFSSLMSALNVAYDARESRPWWEQKLIAIGATIGAVFTIGIAMALFLGGGALVDSVAGALGLGTFGTVVWAVLQYVLALALLIGAIWGIYIILPDLHAQDKKQALVGAVLATLLWIVFSIAFRVYVVHFGAYNRTYGAIGAVIVLLSWMYWSMFAILAGGELNSELRAGTGSSAIPSRQSTVPNRVPTHQGLPNTSSELR